MIGSIKAVLLGATVLVACSLLPSTAQAQTSPPAPSDSAASELSKVASISIDQAKVRIGSMRRLSDLQKKLREDFPDNFSFVSTDDLGQSFTIGLKGSSTAASVISAFSQGLRVSIVQANLSAKDRKDLVDKVMSALKTLKIKASVSINERTNEVRILTRNSKAVKDAIASGLLQVPAGTVVEDSDGIILTTVNWSGGANYNGYDGSSTYQGCTFGFSVVTYTVTTPPSPFYGNITAAHCTMPYAKIDAYPSSTYASPSSISANMTYRYGGLNDIALWSYSNQSTNKPRPGFWDGSVYTDLTGVIEDYHGEFVCKFGRTSGKTCGAVDDVKTTDSYGTFSRVLVTQFYPKQSVEGDSGGPVFQTSLAAGIVHGRDAAYNMYYSAATTWRSNVGLNVFYLLGPNGATFR